MGFVESWEDTSGQDATMSIREIATAFDSSMALMLTGAGAGVGAAGLAAAAAASAEDDGQTPLHCVRPNPANLFPIFVSALTTACTTLSAAFAATTFTTPPNPAACRAAWMATPCANLNADFDNAVADYLSSTFGG